MSLDTRLRTAAQRVFRRLGTVVTLRRITLGSYDVTNGTAADTTLDVPWSVRLDEYTDRELQGTIKAGDRRATGAAADLDFAPVETDRLVIAGVEWEVIRVQTELATNLAAVYVLQIRR